MLDRELAESLKEVNKALKTLVGTELRTVGEAAVRLDELSRDLQYANYTNAKLRKGIESAPHGDRCDSQWNPVSVFFGDCNCWKSELNEPEVSSAP